MQMIKNACTYRITLQLFTENKEYSVCSFFFPKTQAWPWIWGVTARCPSDFQFASRWPRVNFSSYWTTHLRNYNIFPLSYISLFPQWERRKKRLPRLVTKIIVLTSWGGVTMLCVRCPDHLSITQGSWGRGWGPKWRTSYVHTHTHTLAAIAWRHGLLQPQPRMRPLRIDLHTNKTSLILAHMWTRTDYTVYISMLRLNGVNFLWPI